MNMRAPAVPLLNIDPYFSLWSPSDRLTDSDVCHWTGVANPVDGFVVIDGEEYRFMGKSKENEKVLTQTNLEINALTTVYTFTDDIISLRITFFSPLFPDDLYVLSLPVAYMKAEATIKDGKPHDIKIKIKVGEEICLNKKGEGKAEASVMPVEGLKVLKMGNTDQKPLSAAGDNLRIDWGYFYLSTEDKAAKAETVNGDDTALIMTVTPGSVIVFAYDDIYSLEYFGKKLKSCWNKDGQSIITAIKNAFFNYGAWLVKAEAFSDKLFSDAVKAGGEKYTELLLLAFRQVLAAHKAVADENGELLYISKECFSGGMGATVDVSYPSIPMFLIYNTECIKGMMRPIFKYAASDKWPFDYSPHDVGLFPCLNGQFYSDGTDPSRQMPVEECGNMLIMAAAVSVADDNADFAAEHMELLSQWVKYLTKYGLDPKNQLCTDDFAGHLAHNCNLSVKAIMGIAAFSIINKMLGNEAEAREYMAKAREMAVKWQQTAANGDGSFRLAFDRPGTFSMKYNTVWDKLFGLGIFAPDMLQSELSTNFSKINPYGMPLDNRAAYTKSDWLVWTATLLNRKEDFERFILPLWNAYNYSPSRVPMTDWYDTVTSLVVGFRHRTVQGGLYIKLLEYSGIMKIKKK